MERKEAIEVIKKNWPDSSFTMLREALETLIPELAESEDERIRKWLVNYFREVCDNVAEKEKNAVLAWLEKQGEQKSNIVPIFKVGDIIKNKKNGDTVKVEQILIDSYCYSGWDGAAIIHSDFLISDQGNWELVEQKPAWSEKDEEMRLTVLQDLQNIKDSYPNVNVEPEFNWLKSIRPQKQWIPSKEQIIALQWILNNVSSYNMYKEEINGLLEQLQKLREEWL